MKRRLILYLLSILLVLTMTSCHPIARGNLTHPTSSPSASVTPSPTAPITPSPTAPERTSPPKTRVEIKYFYHENSPVYQTVAQLVADSHYVFKGTLVEIDRVENASWFWEIYKVEDGDFYKGSTEDGFIRMINDGDYRNKRHVGRKFLIFADKGELPVYPYPLINPIYSYTVFEIQWDGSLRIEKHIDESVLPVVFEERFATDYHQLIFEDPASFIQKPTDEVIDRFDSYEEMLQSSDLVLRVTFGELNIINEYVTMAFVKETQAEYGIQSFDLSSIFVNEDVLSGIEYFVFLRLSDEKDCYLLAARSGAIVSSEQTSEWEEVAALLQSKKII